LPDVWLKKLGAAVWEGTAALIVVYTKILQVFGHLSHQGKIDCVMPVWVPWLGLGLYCANVLLGAGLQLRLYNLHRAKWVHHALYFCVFVAAIASTFAGGRWWAMLPTLACLAVLPRFKGGSRWHMGLTLGGLVGYGLVLV
jgi:protein-S-isoprenylcysteine O-methyltransferase Ste14